VRRQPGRALPHTRAAARATQGHEGRALAPVAARPKNSTVLVVTYSWPATKPRIGSAKIIVPITSGSAIIANTSNDCWKIRANRRSPDSK